MKLLPTTIVGSYPQPEWLIDTSKLAARFPPRVRARELWRIAPEFLQEAQDDATIMAIKAQEDAGIDIITDGEMRRESYRARSPWPNRHKSTFTAVAAKWRPWTTQPP